MQSRWFDSQAVFCPESCVNRQLLKIKEYHFSQIRSQYEPMLFIAIQNICLSLSTFRGVLLMNITNAMAVRTQPVCANESIIIVLSKCRNFTLVTLRSLPSSDATSYQVTQPLLK